MYFDNDEFVGIWYADDADCPYQDAKQGIMLVDECCRLMNDLFSEHRIVASTYSETVSIRLYRHDSMGHNVETSITVHATDNKIRGIELGSFDIGPEFEDGIFSFDVPTRSESITFLQIMQVMDYLNKLTGEDLKFEFGAS